MVIIVPELHRTGTRRVKNYVALYQIIIIISYHIISYHIISYHIISYHIISYHIISYHIILSSYHIITNLHTVIVPKVDVISLLF